MQTWSPMNLNKSCGMRCKRAVHCLLSKLPGAKLNFVLKATWNINGPVFLFITNDQNDLAILTFALCYICGPIKICSGVSRAWNAEILSKFRLVCPNYTANTPMSCSIIKMARWTLNWRVFKQAAQLKKSGSNVLQSNFMHFYRTCSNFNNWSLIFLNY